MRIKGICRSVAEDLAERTTALSQGRGAGCIGFVDAEGYVSSRSEIIDGGVSALPSRKILAAVADIRGLTFVEAVECLPENAVLLVTRPGQTGIITNVGTIDMFACTLICIGVKGGAMAGVGVVYPEPGWFDLATRSEMLELETLRARTMDEEKAILRRAAELNMAYLEISQGLPVVEDRNGAATPVLPRRCQSRWRLPRLTVKSLDRALAERLVGETLHTGQGREVATIGLVDEEGHVRGQGSVVIGGMGAVPARLLASSITDIRGKSLFHIYRYDVPENAVIIHTHPGGTGVMHAGDAAAGPATWGRPIIAVGHDRNGQIQGATVITVSDRLIELADENEALDVAFFGVKTPEEEAEIRNRQLGIAQEYTNLCEQIVIR